jgi:hypothetical protein
MYEVSHQYLLSQHNYQIPEEKKNLLPNERKRQLTVGTYFVGKSLVA